MRSDAGLAATLYPLKQGYLGSGSGDKVFEQAGLDGAGQLAAITAWVKSVETKQTFPGELMIASPRKQDR